MLLTPCAGSLSFFIFRSRTTAHFFVNDVFYGGAKYIPTGRGYALKHNSFVKVYSNYARSHLYYASELLLLLILLALSDPESYAATTWSTWMVCISILWAPFWFNPGSFLLEKTK
jgi:1,3-beta-glucan synthase component